MLSHGEIGKAIESGEIAIEPFERELIKRNSCLLRLGRRFRRIEADEILDVGDQESLDQAAGEPFEASEVIVDSTSLVLASSLERVALAPDLVGVLSGISNVARLGVIVHATSAFVNAGFGWGAPTSVTFELAVACQSQGTTPVASSMGPPRAHIDRLAT